MSVRAGRIREGAVEGGCGWLGKGHAVRLSGLNGRGGVRKGLGALERVLQVQARLLEFPAGTLEDGEDPLESMQRELGEEAGYSAARWDSLGPMLPCPGYSDEVIHCFLARQLTPLLNPPAGDADEDLEVLEMTPAELDAALASGEEWLDGKSVTAWFRAKQLLDL